MSGRRGFTLLEVLVATLIMAIAVTGLLGALRTSLTNAARLTDTERGLALARRQMDELLVTRMLPRGVPFEGVFPPETTGGLEAGWRAQVVPFEGQTVAPGQKPPPGSRMVERIHLLVWWKQGEQRRTMELDAYRGIVVTPEMLPFIEGMPLMTPAAAPAGTEQP